MSARKGMRQKHVLPCGTAAAYRRHYNRGEKPCDVCRRSQTALSLPTPETLSKLGERTDHQGLVF